MFLHSLFHGNDRAQKTRLAQNRTSYPLFDTDRFRRHIEAAYITMWQRYQRGEPPESFEVQPIQRVIE